MNAVIASAGLWLSECGEFTISTAPDRSVRAATGRPGPGQPPRQVRDRLCKFVALLWPSELGESSGPRVLSRRLRDFGSSLPAAPAAELSGFTIRSSSMRVAALTAPQLPA